MNITIKHPEGVQQKIGGKHATSARAGLFTHLGLSIFVWNPDLDSTQIRLIPDIAFIDFNAIYFTQTPKFILK